jgi:hypothetical protein
MLHRLITLCGTAAVAAAASASAEDFPLKFRTIPVREVTSFPGGSGIYSQLASSKPVRLQAEPKAKSRHPLYGECRDPLGGTAFIFRLDESRGDGRGYDQLIVDMNGNDDLTDDAIVQRDTVPADRGTQRTDQYLFGPIQAAEGKLIAGGRPFYFARVYIFSSMVSSFSRASQSVPSGQLTLKPGWYLETTVKLDGFKRKVGVIDGNSNLRLGDISQPQTLSIRGEGSWYFPTADSWLIDSDGSGTFESSASQSEAYPFSPLVYLDRKPYKIGLSPDCKSLHVEPWRDALADVVLRPQGGQVSSLTLAWEQTDRTWQQICPAVVEGKIAVPPGDYRLYACSVVGKSRGRDPVLVSGMQRTLKPTVNISSDQANTLDCGGPFEVQVTTTRANIASRLMSGADSNNPRLDPAPVLRINASLVGAGGEVYNTFLKGERFQSRPPRPSYKIADAAGKSVANGYLEYG